MPQRPNPLKLNPLQQRTLAILQQIARATGAADGSVGEAGVRLGTIVPPHGNHFHIGDGLVMAEDATGLGNPAVFTALERKGLVRETVPGSTTLTAAGLAYDTGIFDRVVRRSAH